jgi:hypothetical protein
MKLKVYQHWDPLNVCIVGACWPPEAFAYIGDSKLRSLFERIAIETQEDLDSLSNFLTRRGVKVLRPNVSRWNEFGVGRNMPMPPVTPRDYHIMVGERFYASTVMDRVDYADHHDQWPGWTQFYSNIKQPDWPNCDNEHDFVKLPQRIQDTVYHCGYLKFRNSEWYSITTRPTNPVGVFDDIYAYIKNCGNKIVDSSHCYRFVNGSMLTRVGQDLYFATEWYGGYTPELVNVGAWVAGDEFRANLIDTGGHSDGTFCPVAPGLIVSYYDQTNYEQSFPGWEIVHGSDKSYLETLTEWHELRKWGYGRYYMPGQEASPQLKDFIDAYLKHWTGNAVETKFFVNILMVDPKTAVVSQYDHNVVRAMERYGITCHVLPLRHQFFWDAGTHCHTCDLDRSGVKQDFFVDRSTP